MNKTIIININGIVFHIEEDAYEVLQNYMTAVKRHFGYSPDSNEIVGDIENRIAEMFGERITPQKAVITMLDVNEVTTQMGHISDFEEFEEQGEEAQYEDTYYTEKKGLFRDPDDKVIGGVCSGLAHYFDIEPKWIRLALVLLFIFGGAGFLIYIILWILMPLARTRADKMSMRGEAATIHNFKRNFDEEMEGLRRNFTEAGRKINPGLKNTARKTGSALENIIKILVKVIGIFVIISAVLGLIALVIATIIFSGSPEESSFFNSFSPVHFIDPGIYLPFVWSVFFATAIPLIALILISVKMISTTKISKYLGYTLLIAWIASLGFITYYATMLSLDYSIESSIVETEALDPYPTYQIAFEKPGDLGSRVQLNGKTYSNRIIQKGNLSLLEIKPRIYINSLMAGETPTVVKRFSADGKNADIAIGRAEHIDYEIVQQKDRLIFDNYAFIKKGDLIRDQEVSIQLNLPVGTHVIIEKSMFSRLYNVSDDDWEDAHDSKSLPKHTEWVVAVDGLKPFVQEKQPATAPQRDSTALHKPTLESKTDTVFVN